MQSRRIHRWMTYRIGSTGHTGSLWTEDTAPTSTALTINRRICTRTCFNAPSTNARRIQQRTPSVPSRAFPKWTQQALSARRWLALPRNHLPVPATDVRWLSPTRLCNFRSRSCVEHCLIYWWIVIFVLANSIFMLGQTQTYWKLGDKCQRSTNYLFHA